MTGIDVVTGKLRPLSLNADGTLRRPPVLVMQTDLARVNLGMGPGWVSGSPAGLAVAGAADCIFDLGPDWAQYALVLITFDPANGTSTGTVVQCSWSPDGATGWLRGTSANSTNAFSTSYAGTLNGANGPQSLQTLVSGRFLKVRADATATNALGAAAKLRVSAYPS